jgi:hypothetical protein
VGTSGAESHNDVSLVTLTAEFPHAPYDTAVSGKRPRSAIFGVLGLLERRQGSGDLTSSAIAGFSAWVAGTRFAQPAPGPSTLR